MDRRLASHLHLLLLVSVLAVAGCGPGAIGEADAQGTAGVREGWDHELRLIPLVDRDPAAQVVDVALEARVERVELAAGQAVDAWTYNGISPGPLIRARVGDRVRVELVNHLPEPTTIHWHGLEVPASEDGVDPQVEPGGTRSYEFTVPHAGTFWYHPHVDSAAQIWRGLYGALIVDDASEPDLGDELTLVLHDLTVENGAIGPAAAQEDLGRFFGHEGAINLVNGRISPTARVPAGSTLRLRLVNAAITRFFRFAIEGQTLLRVAGDSGFSERAQSVSDVVLAPGERAEVVVVLKGAVGQRMRVRSLAYDRFACTGCSMPSELMTFELTGGRARTPVLPTALAAIPPLDLRDAIPRVLDFAESARTDRPYLTVNGHIFGLDSLELRAAVNTTEVWTLRNVTQYDHPFHMHGFRFQVLEAAGRAPAVREWKDTLNLRAESESRIAVRYDDRPGMWMFHCHILDHAELGMMGMLHVEAPVSPR